jgi:KipI family sensor histidine kinase inhibitor
MNARRAGDRGWLLEVDDPTRVAAALRHAYPELEEIVPGHETVLVIGDFSPVDIPVEGFELPTACVVEIAVTYDGEDLSEVASLTGLSVDDIVSVHTAATYTAAFLGFAPGFAYLTGLDERLVVPRREQPRERVPSGSVAIAGPYSGVYPRVTPGGWRLLGRTDAVLFDSRREQPALIQAGDTVRFVQR